jgi:NTP pyrophosphatase (non-canonical NTP hydrolase)
MKTITGTLEQLENINVERAKIFPDYHKLITKDVVYYANALAGETGEFCNLIKKLIRGDKYDRDGKTELTPYHICHELADIIIYAEFITSIYGFSLSSMLREKFNSVSLQKGSELFINKTTY